MATEELMENSLPSEQTSQLLDMQVIDFLVQAHKYRISAFEYNGMKEHFKRMGYKRIYKYDCRLFLLFTLTVINYILY